MPGFVLPMPVHVIRHEVYHIQMVGQVLDVIGRRVVIGVSVDLILSKIQQNIVHGTFSIVFLYVFGEYGVNCFNEN